MKPSKFHSNRDSVNWLAYKIGDRFLEQHSSLYKGHLVDLGCGEAPYKEYFLQYADHYTGVDWTKTLHNSKADIVSDLNKKIEMDNDVADTVVTLSVMEHLCEPQVFLNEAYRILKKNGYIILQVPFQWWVHEAPHDYFRYTPYGLKYLFDKAGFKEVEIKPQSGFFTMWLLKFNYFTSRFTTIRKPFGWLIKAVLIPFWFINQIVAPLLDKTDRVWSAETSGYWVTAKK